MATSAPRSTITWFYYDAFDDAARFYETVLELEKVLDAGWARIFRTTGNAFVGVVDAGADKGVHRTQPENAVLLTLVVDDVDAWYERLSRAGAAIQGEVKEIEEIKIRTFFLADPGGYAIEIQEFLDPNVRPTFHGQRRASLDP